MSKTIVVTRPKEERDGLGEMLHQRGFSVVYEPLSRILLQHTAAAPLSAALEHDPAAVLVTSRHGVHALAALSELRDLPLLCVGEATAGVASSAGFTRVTTAGGTTQQMIEYILSSYDLESRFLYVSAEHVRSDLAEILARQGMLTQRVVVYESLEATQFSDVFCEHLKRQHIDAITFLSQRTAKTFMTLVTKAKLKTQLSGVAACCFSDTVAEPLAKAKWRSVFVAQKPTLASLVECIDNCLMHDQGTG